MSPEPSVRVVSGRALRIAALVAGAIALLLVGSGIAARAASSRHLRQWTSANAEPVVSVMQPQPGDSSYALELPGRLEAYSRAPIYARVNGYLKDWKVDIGSAVRTGQVLGEIEAPDLDQQLSQAKADLMTAQANEALAKTTAERWQRLLKTDSVSVQEVDMKVGDFAAKEAIVKAASANVERLQVLEGFKRMVAPFDGIVTARDTDVGALINAGSGKGLELFVVSDVHKLRLYVNVPQNYVAQVTSGTQAKVTVPERPGQTFAAIVESSSQSVDPSSGATLVQLGVDNQAGQLLPGAFANVHFDLPVAAADLSVPASALIFDHRGVRVATVGPDNRIAFKPVSIARDLGDVVQISSGLAASDRIVDSPPDGIGKGDQVRIATATTNGAAVADASTRPSTQDKSP
ncbi:MAG TPA: efflux RND transporter periplasmic adaptor subunit [Burkholderiaceae bacterium]|jgi:RND family efflux transporter MFP subunit|nr:efflux RND transporter periplasmic adaptor subunit [Burkholderiaceae bacterium]